MINNVILDIDALDDENKAYIKIFGKEIELVRLTVEDHIKMTSIDQRMQNLNMNEQADRDQFAKDMKDITSKLLPELTEEDLKILKFDHYLKIREVVNDQMMKDRGLSEKEIEKAKKQQKKMMLNMTEKMIMNMG